MKYLVESFMQLLGRAPTRPEKDDITPAAQEIHFYKRGQRLDMDEVRRLHDEKQGKNKWLKRRWATLLFVNLLFVVSYYFDIQLLEGALTASRFLGFHMADLNSALQVMLAFKTVLINLLIGTVTVFVLWFLVGGRSFCSWGWRRRSW
jgi:ferredoxin-type protein NapH